MIVEPVVRIPFGLGYYVCRRCRIGIIAVDDVDDFGIRIVYVDIGFLVVVLRIAQLNLNLVSGFPFLGGPFKEGNSFGENVAAI